MNVNSKRDGFVPQKLIQLWKRQRWRAVNSQHCSSPQARSSSSRVSVMAAVEVAAAVVIVLALLWLSRGKNPNPMLDRLIESASSAILSSHQELGGGRHVLRTGRGELRREARDLTQYGQILAGYCRKSEIRLPAISRAASL